MRDCYKEDSLFGPVIKNPEQYPMYAVNDGLIYHGHRLCIPSEDRNTREELLRTYHDAQNHFSTAKTQAAITQDLL